MPRLPDLEGWAIFAKVVQAGSFARAATELGLSNATVSKAVRRLETRLRTDLLHRTSRSLSLTDSGRACFSRAATILAEAEAVESEVADQAKVLRGTIRVAAPMSFGVAHVAPLLPEFASRYPEVAVDLHLSDEVVDLVGGGFDIGLRIGALADSSLRARRLFPVRRMVVGAPAYFERHGRPDHPRDLERHRALLYSNLPTPTVWRFSHPSEGEWSVTVDGPITANNAQALAPALLAGEGVALQPEFLVGDDLRRGSLVTVLDDWALPPVALHVVTPPGTLRPIRVKALIDFLAERFRTPPWAEAA